MFVIIFFVLGLCFGFAARLPWALLAFLVPLALAVAASDRDYATIVVAFIVTAIGIMLGLVLSVRSENRSEKQAA